MECRCTHVDVLYDGEAEEYAAEHLRSDGTALDPEQHLSRRP